MHRRSKNMKGLTIMEALITILVLGILIGIIAGICSEYSRLIHYSSSRDKTIFSLQGAMDGVKGELAEALAVTSPRLTAAPLTSAGTFSSELQFTKIDPANPSRLPTPFPSPMPSVWASADSAHVLSIRYYAAGGALMREVTYPDKTSQCHVIVAGISGFSVQDLGNNSAAITASFMDDDILKTFTTRVHLSIREQ
jgi:hypothetical protein